MTKNTKYISITVLAILALILIGVYYSKESTETNDDSVVTQVPASSTNTNPTTNGSAPHNNGTTVTKPTTPLTNDSTKGFHSYANAPYNFTMKFPADVQSKTSFSTFHQIGNNWRLNAAQANQGKGLASFTIFSVDQGSYTNGKQTYPLYYLAEVRVGVSPNVGECYTTDAGYTNQKVANVDIGGVTFKKFSSQDAGMMKYTQAESYRTVHNNMCYVIEQIKAGSSYRDNTMKTGTTEAMLTNYYTEGETIVKTFRFTK